jgi:hypothetical protein
MYGLFEWEVGKHMALNTGGRKGNRADNEGNGGKNKI